MSALRTLPITRGYAQPDSMSARLWRRAQEVLPGDNSRTTVFMAPHPIYAAEGESGWVTDVDGDRRLDLLNNYTSLIHGHAHPAVTEAATRRLARGASFPLPTPEEIELAALMCERVESVERVRFTNSGSEAVMMAIKGARGFTGRHRIAKFEGAYHGSYDYAEVSLGASPEEWGRLAEPASIPYSKGTPPSVLQDVVVLPLNYADLAAARIEREAKTLAARRRPAQVHARVLRRRRRPAHHRGRAAARDPARCRAERPLSSRRGACSPPTCATSWCART
jgi:glutamate-1-semialdehyde 2,1-aminomutase